MTENITIEQKIKKQFSKIFLQKDWEPFKQSADYYFQLASLLKKKDIKIEKDHKLWIRNVRKRLYLGIATELLLKAVYLKYGYNINKPKKKPNIKINFPEFIAKLNQKDLNETKTYMLEDIINNLDKIEPSINANIESSIYKKIKDGLIICQIFRNKEGHVAVPWHKFDPYNYYDIEFSIKKIYEIYFSQTLNFQISMERNEKGVFRYTLV